jgi:hypothetical protein
MANGSIACWGFNDTQGWCESERTPLSAVAISAGDQFTAALTSTMNVSVWPYLRYCDADDGCFTNGQIAVESPLMISCSGQHLVVLAEDCSTSCSASISGNCWVDGADLGILLSQWGSCQAGNTECEGDLNSDGLVNGADLGYLLNAWGPCSN